MMTAQQFMSMAPYLLSITASLGICYYTWRHRSVSGAGAYSVVAGAQALTTLAYVAEITSDDLVQKLFWDDVQWFTLSVVVIAALVFALSFTHRHTAYLRQIIAVLVSIPALFFALLATNAMHHLVRDDVRVIPGQVFSILTYEFTPVTMLMSIYLIQVGLASMAVLVRRLLEVDAPYRGQIMTILAGLGLPTLAGLLSITGVMLSEQRDITPLMFALGSVMVGYGLFRYRLFSVAPIARTVIFESMADAVLVLDTAYRIIDINPAARQLLARFVTAQVSIGRPIQSVFAQWPNLTAHFQQMLTAAESEIVVNDGDDRVILSVTAAPIRPEGSYVNGYVVLIRDVSERRRTEARLLQTARDLELARNEALEVNRQKSQFVAAVSHELRTPLNAIINFNQFVSSGLFGEVNPRQTDALEKSTDSARHLLALINDLLDMSKIEAGRLDLALEPQVDLTAEIEAIRTTADSLIGDKLLRLMIDIAGDLPPVSADRRRMRQVLLNLLSNAIKYTDVGYVRVCAWWDADRVVIAVEDSGPGIPPEHHDLIFEPFRQLKRDSGKAGSTGLGLPLARRLVEAHGGSLWLESKLGVGSTFYFSLPHESESPKTAQITDQDFRSGCSKRLSKAQIAER